MKRKRLSLKQETIKKLSPEEMSKVAGATVGPCMVTVTCMCTASCFSCQLTCGGCPTITCSCYATCGGCLFA